MNSRKYKIIIFLLFMFTIDVASMVKGSDVIQKKVPFYLEKVKHHVNVEFVMNYRLGILMGEPVRYGEVAVCIPKSIFPDVKFRVSKLDVRGSKWYMIDFIRIDMGAVTRVFRGTAQQFKALSEEEREKYYSLNVTGSPNWSKLFESPYGLNNLFIFDEKALAKKNKKKFIDFMKSDVHLKIHEVSLSASSNKKKDKNKKQEKKADSLNTERQLQAKNSTSSRKDTLSKVNSVAQNKTGKAIEKRSNMDVDTKRVREKSNVGKNKNSKKNEAIAKADNKKNLNIAKGSTQDGALLLLMDVSGSMRGERISEAKKAATKLIQKAVSKNTYVSLMAYSGDCSAPIKKKIPFTKDSNLLISTINSLVANGGTPLSAAVESANHYMKNYSETKSVKIPLIVLLADGENSCGNVKSSFDKLKQSGIIFKHETIGLGVSSNSVAAQELKYVASNSGGSYHHAASPKELQSVFMRTLDAMEILEMIGEIGNKTKKHKPKTTNENKIKNDILNSIDWD